MCSHGGAATPTKPAGVYADGRGGWYFKADLGKDPLTGKRVQITKRGYSTAAAAGRARRDLIDQADRGLVTARSAGLTVDALLDLYLDGLDADDKLSAKTRFDYRRTADGYIRPTLGPARCGTSPPA